MNLTRRKFLGGLLAAPAVITTSGLLMPVQKIIMPEAKLVYEDTIFRVTEKKFYVSPHQRKLMLEIAAREGYKIRRELVTCDKAST